MLKSNTQEDNTTSHLSTEDILEERFEVVFTRLKKIDRMVDSLLAKIKQGVKQ